MMQVDITPPKIAKASRAGFEHVSAWADLLDRINVYPVADGDTGINLRVSLAPLLACEDDCLVTDELLSSGHGNSGNIACAFLAAFLCCDGTDLSLLAKTGRNAAYDAIADPKPGTMLSVFDSLCEVLDEGPRGGIDYPLICARLAETTLAGISRLPELEAAGVVDSGALGMFIFLAAFFHTLTDQSHPLASLDDLFGDTLEVAATYSPKVNREHCVEAVVKTTLGVQDIQKGVNDLGSSAVVVQGNGNLKVHLHTTDPGAFREALEAYGAVSDWSNEEMDSMTLVRREKQLSASKVRIICDAAGSISRDLASKHGIIPSIPERISTVASVDPSSTTNSGNPKSILFQTTSLIRVP